MKSTNIFRTVLSFVTIFLIMSLSVFGQGNLTNKGSWTNTGTLKVKNFTNSGAAAAFTNNGASSQLWIKNTLTTTDNSATAANFDVTNGTVRYYNADVQTVNAAVKDSKYNNLYLDGGGAKTLSGSITLTGTATAASTASLAISTFTVTAAGTTPFTATGSGSYSFGSGVVDYNGTYQSVYNTTYGTLTASTGGAKTIAGDVSVSTAMNLNAGTLAIDGKTLTLNGSISDNTGAGTITGSTTSNLILGGSGAVALPVIAGNNLGAFTFARTGGATIDMKNNITVNGNLWAGDGTLDVKSNTLTLLGTVAGTTGGFASNNDGTVVYGKTTDGQTVFAAQYGNLSFSDYAKTLPAGTVSIAGLFNAGASNLHTVATSTIAFNSSSIQTIPAFNTTGTGYYNLTTVNGSKGVSGDLKVAGNFTNGAGVVTNVGTYALNITGTKSQADDAATMQFGDLSNGVIFTTGTVEYNGLIAQTITGASDVNADYYKQLKLSGSNTKTVTGASAIVRTTGNMTVNAGLTLAVAATGDLRVEGDLENQGTLDNSGSITVGN